MTQNNMNLIRLSDLSRDQSYNLQGADLYDPTGYTAYGVGGDKVGTIRDALVQADTGRIQYFIVDAGGWFSSKEVLVPVGHSRLENDGVYFDDLTKAQVGDLREYNVNDSYTNDHQESDERVLRGVEQGSAAATDTAARTAYQDKAYRTPDKLQLMEERLVVNKDRFKAGSVEIGKHVETRQENVNVALQREEVVIERRTVTDSTPVEGAVLGAGSQTVNIDLEAERANVTKQAYVTEEIGIGKRTVTDTQTVSETVGREVLDVNKTGDVRLENGDQTMTDIKSDNKKI
ncbi:DUF2382 domain-containing protein [Deinococcus psychrotolerans]|uniref:DUF2382 domain-containing protein n=1 Tax=Deinococcus psychrotolerans TaxID=2489213 RepID=A0A3G8Y877_9DEIO|nr:DUF2382 domain-containing protein [Deinococcus psychrotolerans]AZI41385.1 DUF2382 domain-containing protein [Deinococcus psychrotolerans]